MITSVWFWTAYVALGLSICSVWFHSVQSTNSPSRFATLPLGIFYLTAIGAGLAGAYLLPSALISLGTLAVLGYAASRPHLAALIRFPLLALFTLLGLALALHALPGFRNALLVQDVQFSPDSAPFTQYANFDKASVGLALLLFFCPRCSSWNEFLAAAGRNGRTLVVIITAVLGLGLLTGEVHVDVKLPAYTPAFMAVNLFFTCVAEEAFFRGFVQEKLSGMLTRFRHGEAIAVLSSALLFGAAHFGAGAAYAGLATAAGFGYALLYSRTRRIEIPILAHFLLNTVHFVAFTYPRAG